MTGPSDRSPLCSSSTTIARRPRRSTAPSCQDTPPRACRAKVTIEYKMTATAVEVKGGGKVTATKADKTSDEK
jgi:hypothetical protein